MNNKIKDPKGDKIFYAVNYFFLTLVGIIMLYPFVYTVAVSFSGEMAVAARRVWLFPIDFTTDSYFRFFENAVISVPRAFYNSLLYAVLTVIGSLIITTMMAYALMKTDMFVCQT